MKKQKRLTSDDIEREIEHEYFFTGLEAVDVPGRAYAPRQIEALGVLTFCVLVLKSGFTVVGTSACIREEDFDAQLGQEIARSKALVKLGDMIAYKVKGQQQ